jgi:hypothetical protein
MRRLTALVIAMGMLACRPHAGLQGTTAPGETRLVDALWFREEPGKPSVGGVTRVRATIVPNPDREVRVGLSEEYSGAMGPQWRTSLWIASFVSALLLSKDMTRYEFRISAGGFIDGPSAGALMAVGFLAAFTGDPIREDATMTGAVSPDGSVAPVGGIPDKVRAAAMVGKKRIGIPRGQAKSRGHDGKEVDNIALGRSLGVEVRELRDLYEAYSWLTGRELPRPTPVAAADMQLDPRVGHALRARVIASADTAEAELKGITKLDGAGVSGAVTRAKRAIADARRHVASGNVPAAYERANRAAALASATAALAAGLSPQAVKERLLAINKAGEAFEKEVSQEPLRDGLGLLCAFGAIVRAMGFLGVSASILSDVAPQPGDSQARPLPDLKKLEIEYLAVVYANDAARSLANGRAFYEARKSVAKPMAIDAAGLRSLTRSLVSAASGNMEYIEALLLSEVATAKKMTLEAVRRAFAHVERSYLLAYQLAQTAVLASREDSASKVAPTLLRLEEAANSYVESAGVLVRWYSLDAELNPQNLPPESVRRLTGLEEMLVQGERAAREAAALVRQRLGNIPSEARLHYLSASVQAKGNTREKLQALAGYWRSVMISRTAAMVLQR